MKKAHIITLLLIFMGIIFLITFHAQATQTIPLKNCGTLNRSATYVLEEDILAGDSCFTLAADNIVLDGNGHMITGNKQTGGFGIYLEKTKGVIVKNITVANFETGIYTVQASNSLIEDTILTSNFEGIMLMYGSENNVFRHNVISLSGNDGILFFDSTHNILDENFFQENFKISSNLIMKNFQVHPLSHQENIFTSNIFLGNIHSFSNFSRLKKEASLGEQIQFSLKMNSFKGPCTSCNATLEVFPKENQENINYIGSSLNGTFFPTQVGIYKTRIAVTDPENNTEIIFYTYLINATGTDTITYYLRGKDPKHGQALSWGSKKSDSGSLLYERPSTFETRSCEDWIEFSFDALPPYLLGIIKEINFSLVYNQSASQGFVGVQRFESYDDEMNLKEPINSTQGLYQQKNFSFNVSWPMNYFWEWYWVSLKLATIDGNPTFITGPSETPTATIIYTHSTTPAIGEVSNRDMFILSATMSNPEEASINLEGHGTTKIIIDMPDTTKKYDALFEGILCQDNNKCLFTHQSKGELEFLLNIKGKSNLKIVARPS